jgi:hypothetical protein
MVTRNALPLQAAIARGFETKITHADICLYVKVPIINASPSDTAAELTIAHLRPLKYQEGLLLLMLDPKLKDALKGNFFYLDRKGLKEKGEPYTINKAGELVFLHSANISPEYMIRVWSGSGWQALNVYSDIDTERVKRRYGLDASEALSLPAPLIVGVPENWKLEIGLLIEAALSSPNANPVPFLQTMQNFPQPKSHPDAYFPIDDSESPASD